MDQEGNLCIIELKKHRTPRDVVAQVLDYASWVQGLTFSDIIRIFEENNPNQAFEKAFDEKFHISPPDELNQSHSILVVAAELDTETERIINYLSDNFNVPINAIFFRYFVDEGNKFLVRSWLIDPNEVEEKQDRSRSQNKGEVWNGNDFVVNFEDKDERRWEDARNYGFVAAGGGNWFTRTLNHLFPGARVFCMIPKKGYVGVGIVEEKAMPISQFKVKDKSGQEKKLIDMPLKSSGIDHDIDDLDRCDYVVRINWLKTIPKEQAYWEKGLSANQNSAFKLKSSYTINKLVDFFRIDND